MKKDKRPFYIWLIAILANVGTYFVIVMIEFSDRILPSISDALLLQNTYSRATFLLALGASLSVTILPVAISRLKVWWKNRLAFGVTILFLIPILYIVFVYFTCSESMCGLIIYSAPIFIALAIVFRVFYSLGTFFAKRSVKFVISIVLVETIILIGAVLFSYVNIDWSLLPAEISSETAPEEIARMCDRFEGKPKMPSVRDCWRKAIQAHPEINICLLSKTSQYECLDVLDPNFYYFSCVGLSYGYAGEHTTQQSEKLLSCWKDAATKYPGVDFCQWLNSRDKETCIAFLKTISTQEVETPNP